MIYSREELEKAVMQRNQLAGGDNRLGLIVYEIFKFPTAELSNEEMASACLASIEKRGLLKPFLVLLTNESMYPAEILKAARNHRSVIVAAILAAQGAEKA